MNIHTSRKLSQIFIATIYIIYLVILAASVIKSGYRYQFDVDEVHNINIVYLLSRGFKMYQSFYAVYGPIFFWLFLPVYKIVGFSFKTIEYARILMIALFFLRIALMTVLVNKIFNKRVALLFIPLFLLDPFTVFSSMQIRPENLAMVFFTLTFLLLYYALDKKSAKLFFISGFAITLSLITSLKILPSAVGVIAALLFYLLKSKQVRHVLLFFDGAVLFLGLFFTYFIIQNNFVPMFQQLFLDPARLNSLVPVPTWLGYFYFMNPVIYGHEGKPPEWMYAWILPVVAFAGGYHMFIERIKEKNIGTKEIVGLMLFFALVLQWFSFLFINSVPIQYYIPILWLYVIFAAYVFDTILFSLTTSKIQKNLLELIFMILLLLLTKSAIKGNSSRLQYNSDQLEQTLNTIWKLIPENQSTFVDVPFRRPIYPIVWNSVKAQFIFDRYGPAYKQIEKYHLKYLVWLDDTELSRYDELTQAYIRNHYERDPNNGLIWIKKVD